MNKSDIRHTDKIYGVKSLQELAGGSAKQTDEI